MVLIGFLEAIPAKTFYTLIEKKVWKNDKYIIYSLTKHWSNTVYKAVWMM